MRCFSTHHTMVFVISVLIGTTVVTADDWPQWRGPQRDGVWRETGIVSSFASDQLPIRWRTAVAPGYSGPTVAAGKVYLTDRVDEPEQVERVHCFDAASGKQVWSFRYPCEYRISYKAGPRASVTINAGRAFALGAMGHLHCFNAETGKLLWKKDLDQLLPDWPARVQQVVTLPVVNLPAFYDIYPLRRDVRWSEQTLAVSGKT